MGTPDVMAVTAAQARIFDTISCIPLGGGSYENDSKYY